MAQQKAGAFQETKNELIIDRSVLVTTRTVFSPDMLIINMGNNSNIKNISEAFNE
jgi:hypothetical protein